MRERSLIPVLFLVGALPTACAQPTPPPTLIPPTDTPMATLTAVPTNAAVATDTGNNATPAELRFLGHPSAGRHTGRCGSLEGARIQLSPFALGCLTIDASDYGGVRYTDYLYWNPPGVIAKFCSRGAIESPISSPEAVELLQAMVGTSHLQVRFHFDETVDDEDALDFLDVEEMVSTIFTVKYRTP